jgi:transcription termination/antitermination protein NusG
MELSNEEFDYLDEEKQEEPVVKPILQVKEAPEEVEAPKEEDGKEETSQLFVVKVTTNKESRSLELISDRIKSKNLEVYAIAKPNGLRGYIFMEAKDKENAEEASFNLPYVKGIIPKKISYLEIKSMIEPITADVNIEREDIVEIVAEPFKKEKAKVIRVDKAKGEVVVSLLGAIIPIPVTVKIDNVRVIRREDEEDS